MIILQRIKKFLILFIAVLTTSIVGISNLHAQDESANIIRLLQLIEQHTNDILMKVNNLPTYLSKITEQAQSWLKIDDSMETAKFQNDFGKLTGLIAQTIDPKMQEDMLTQLTADAFNQPISSLTTPRDNPAILNVLPIELININDISYSTVLGLPPIPKRATQNSPYNFIKFASGIRTPHVIPRADWGGDTEKQLNYLIYFATVKAVESFSGYVLSHQLLEPQFTPSQLSLINQASDSKTWLAQVASEDLGRVLRQILLFQSQAYVLMTQQVQLEKQLLAANAMTNSILILNNATNETLLVAKAKGEQPEV